MIPTMIGNSDRDQRRREHALDRRAGDDVDRAAVLGPRRPLHDPRVLAELAPHLLHDLAADAADRLHRERREQERHQAADEQAGDHPRVREAEQRRQPLVGEAGRVRVEEDERGERGRADRVALRHGLRRVADGVERIGDRAHLVRQVGHLGDAAGVVGHRAVGVERDDQARHRELRHHGDADAVELREVVRDEDAGRDHDHRRGGRLHPDGEAFDDVRRVARLRRARDRLHRDPARARVVLGDRRRAGTSRPGRRSRRCRGR